MFSLQTLALPWKLLITFFLIVLSSGFVVSELYLMETTEMADGKKGMSLDDITYTFYGNRSDKTKTKLRKMVNGSMKKYFAEGGDEKNLKPEDLEDIKKVVAWNDAGAAEDGYWDPKLKAEDKNKQAVFNLLSNHGCYDCHSKDADMKGNKKDSPLDTFADISRFTAGDTGMDPARLLMLSHVHLLGMGMMFLLVGAAVAASAWPTWIRCSLIVCGLSSILLDIFGWWGVKYGGAPFSPVVMLGGIMMAASFGGSVFVALFDLWLRKYWKKKPGGASVGEPVITTTVQASGD